MFELFFNNTVACIRFHPVSARCICGVERARFELVRRKTLPDIIFYKMIVPVQRSRTRTALLLLLIPIQFHTFVISVVEMHLFVIGFVASSIALAHGEPLPGTRLVSFLYCASDAQCWGSRHLSCIHILSISAVITSTSSGHAISWVSTRSSNC